MSIAVSDLALETTILSNLQHKNIISLRGVKSGDMIESLSEGNFFILLDLLVDTLDARLERWAKQHNLSFFAGHRLDEGRIARRLKNVAMGIAAGMEYLHSRNILFR
jgi:serine/threonine protein kinase